MFIPVWLLSIVRLAFGALAAWTILLARRRNPLPFPDPGSRIFSASSPEAKDVMVQLLARYGIRERF